MTLSQMRVGIDVAKAWLDICAAHGAEYRIENTTAAITAFLDDLAIENTTIIIEATGPYDADLRQLAQIRSIALRRVNPGRARDYAKAAGILAKTDKIDARVLRELPDAVADLDDIYDAEREHLAALNRRRRQLVETRAAERTRLHDARDAEQTSIETHIAWLSSEIKRLEGELRKAVAKSETLKSKARMLRSAPGVGDVTTHTLLALLPELGQRSTHTIAALAGLAPINNDSGKRRGKRQIRGGRKRVRTALYHAALSAIRCCDRFRAFYLRIVERSGGKKKVALIAVARKLLVTLNAMIRKDEKFRGPGIEGAMP